MFFPYNNISVCATVLQKLYLYSAYTLIKYVLLHWSEIFSQGKLFYESSTGDGFSQQMSFQSE